MNERPQRIGNERERERKEVRSYVVGFMLSLLFTLIPYTLVVNQSFSGTTLTAVIIGFAMLQLLIQVTFFLHLGRGPKPKWNLFFFTSTVVMCVVVVGGSIFIISQLYKNMAPSDQVKKLANDENIYQVNGKKTGACEELRTNYQVVIMDGKATPNRTYAHVCDTLTFTNKDNLTRVIVFRGATGQSTYAGETSVTLAKATSSTITLSETGSYQFYDQPQNTVSGEFIVSPR